MTKVFVYGSLKRGSYNHGILGTSKRVGIGWTKDRWAMLDGGFPVVMPGEDGQVVGEVYDVSATTLERLDRLEGNGHMYQREVIIVELDSGETIDAWMYVGMPHWLRYNRSPIRPQGNRLNWHVTIWDEEEVNELRPE